MYEINVEMRDIAISTLALSFAFMILLFGNLTFSNFLISIGLVGVSFIGHELAHRTVAKSYGALAFYRMWPTGILILLATSFLGFLIAAPGAVQIAGKKGRWTFDTMHFKAKEMGLISLSGPVINLGLAGLFLILNFLVPVFIFKLGYMINFWLAFINLLPVPPLDGSKIMGWDARVWFLFFLMALVATFFI